MKKLTKKLTLNKETLKDLTDPDLDRVAGGGGPHLTYRPQTSCVCPSVSTPSCICYSGQSC